MQSVPGEAVYKGHQSYELMRNLQLGIMFSIAKSGQVTTQEGSQDPSIFRMEVSLPPFAAYAPGHAVLCTLHCAGGS